MNLHQLNVFKVIVERGSFSKAAQELSIAQSAVSYHIKLLEEEIGDPVFLRVKTRVYLTETGKMLWGHVEKIFKAVEEAQQAMAKIGQHRGGEVHFGLGVSSLADQLPEFLKHFKEVCPGVRFDVVMGSPPQIVDQIRQNMLDLGIVSLPVQAQDILTIPLFYEEEEMVVILNQKSALAKKKAVSPADLVGLPLILYNKSTATRSSLDKFFQEAGVDPIVFMEADREETIMSLVKNGLGASILPRCILEPQDEDALCFLPLRNAFLRREVVVAALKSPSRPYLVEQAIHLCQEHFHLCKPKSLPGQKKKPVRRSSSLVLKTAH